jgi:hypothetical protein
MGISRGKTLLNSETWTKAVFKLRDHQKLPSAALFNQKDGGQMWNNGLIFHFFNELFGRPILSDCRSFQAF